MEKVRLYEMPACRMVASGRGMFGDGVLEWFMTWMETQPRSVFPKDFLGGDEKGFVWYYLYEEGMSTPEGLDVPISRAVCTPLPVESMQTGRITPPSWMN